jgi:ATP-binding cassette, subfamily B, bacterial
VQWIPAVVRIYREDWPRVVLALALAVGVTAAGLLKPWPLAQLVDGWGRSPSASPDTAKWVAALFALYALHAGLGALLNLVLIHTGLRGLQRVRQSVFDWLLGLSMRRLLGSQAGDLIYRSTWDTYAFQTLFQHGVFTFLTASGSLVAMSVVMWRINRPLALVALATVPPLLIVMQAFGKGIGGRADAAQKADSRLASRFQQAVSHLALIQGFTAEPQESRRFQTDATASLHARGRQHAFELGYLASVGIVFAAGTAAIVWFGSRELAAGRLSLGTFLVFLAYLAQFYEPLQQLSGVGTTVSNAGAGARRILELLSQPREPRPPQSPVPLPAANPSGRSITFENVSFGYQPGQHVLSDFNLTVRPGETLAIIGPSGVGKSTLLGLVPRFMDPDAGTLRIDGIDLRQLSLADLRKCIAWVPQEPILLPGSIAENLAYGRPGASLDQIRAAAKAAQAHAFIERLPQGYDTVVGDGAIHMSVGEKQRLNLARAFLKDAPILLLDEPTSALDASSETLVIEALSRLRQGRTTLMVAHRLQTLSIVDRTVTLQPLPPSPPAT